MILYTLSSNKKKENKKVYKSLKQMSPSPNRDQTNKPKASPLMKSLSRNGSVEENFQHQQISINTDKKQITV